MFVMLFVLLRCSLCRLTMPWLNMSMGVFSVIIIVSGMVAPIMMVSFPSMETLQPEWFTDQPDITRSQIEILVPNDTDEFDTIPDVSFRNHDWRHFHRLWGYINRLRSYIHRLRSRNDYGLER
jgi:hypothetical protein